MVNDSCLKHTRPLFINHVWYPPRTDSPHTKFIIKILNTVPKVYTVLSVISLIVIRRSESNSHPTIRVQRLFDCFNFLCMDAGRPGLGSSVTELSPCSNILYQLYKAVFFIALFPKAVSNISNVSCRVFWFATNKQKQSQAAVQGQPFCLFGLSVSRAFV